MVEGGGGGLRVKFTLHMCTHIHTCRGSQQMNTLVQWALGNGKREGCVCGWSFTAQIRRHNCPLLNLAPETKQKVK